MHDQLIQAFVTCLMNNQGNRLTPELITGMLQTVGQVAASAQAAEEAPQCDTVEATS